MAEWWTIEVLHGDKEPATRWQEAHGDALIEAAVTNGALYWEWREFAHGVVFELCFPDEARWDAFRNLPAVKGALDSAPDPVNGLLVYRGRGGAAGGRKPRKPKPAPSAAALELEEPKKHRRIRLRSSSRGLGKLREELGAPGPLPDPTAAPSHDPAPEPARPILPDRQSAARG
jgi:hypothetical protein